MGKPKVKLLGQSWFLEVTVSRILELDPVPRRIFAVGDIHGCAAEVAVLCDYLKDKEALTEDDALLFIGDYVDRGPDSRAVIDLMLDCQREFPQVYFLRGNHEDMLLDYLGLEGSMGGSYLQNGGAETFKSYGIDPFISPEEILAQFPKQHLSFINNLDRMVIAGDRVYVHAGLDPLRDLGSQLNQDMFWIRDEFILNIHYFEKLVVFGHTAFKDLFYQPPYKLGIDTALVYGNRLSCVELSSGQVYQVVKGGKKVKVYKFAKKAKGGQAPRYFGR